MGVVTPLLECALPVLALVAWLAPATAAAEPEHWADSDRKGDLVYFGMYAGVSFASKTQLTYTLDGGGKATQDDVQPGVSGVGGYQMTFWPYDFLGFDMSAEVFGLPLSPTKPDASPTVAAEGFGTEWGPTVRVGVPLYVVQPNIGLGLMLPLTILWTQAPQSSVAVDFGAAARAVGGINVYVSKRFRLYGEYRFEYVFATVNPGAPLDLDGLIRHSVVLGFMFSPEGYRKLPASDKLTRILLPFIAPAALSILGVIGKATQGSP